jgi:CheY-like chemotaxis protein
MKKRRILIIHEQGTFRTIIRRALNAEVPDVDLHTASSAQEAIELLEKEFFDMVISANEMAHMNGTGIYEKMMASGRHKSTGFLLLTSKLDEQNKKIFAEKSITNVLKMPFMAGQLAHQVENLSKPSEWRQHKRYEMPEALVRINLGKKVIQANIVNLSLGGLLCDLKAQAGSIPEYSKVYPLNITIPDFFEAYSVNVKAYLLRQAALHWLEPPIVDVIQSAWRFAEVSDSDQEVLDEILQKASEDTEEF